MTLDILVKTALEGSSIEATCADLQGVVDSNTVRRQLQQAMDSLPLRTHEAEMNHALASTLPTELSRGNVQIALDWHDEPFYGKTAQMRDHTCHAQAKAGTTHFFRLASACLIAQDVRLTLALTYVLPEDSTEMVVERLLQRLDQLHFHHTTLLLDKGFCTGAVLRLLQARQQKALLACPIRGKTGGTKALCKGRKSYTTDYTFTDGTTVRVVLVATLVPNRNGKQRRKWLMFVTLGLAWSPKQVYQRYRRRFGIEASYRLLRQARATTNSRHPLLRFFFLGLALLLQNVWLHLRWFVARLPARGPRRVDPTLLRFERFKRLLLRAIEHRYSVVTVLDVYRLPESVIH